MISTTSPGRDRAEHDRRAAWWHLADPEMADRWDELGEGLGGRLFAEVAAALDRLSTRAYLRDTGALDEVDVLAALLVIRQLRDDFTEAEGHLIEAARARGVTWARLASALEVKSRQSAERRYLSLRGDESGHATTTRDRVHAARDHRAEAKARTRFLAEHADDIRALAERLAAVPGLQQRADAAEADHQHRTPAAAVRRARGYQPPARVTWPGRLAAAIEAGDLAEMFHHLWQATPPAGLDLADHQDLMNLVAAFRQKALETELALMRQRWRARGEDDDQD